MESTESDRIIERKDSDGSVGSASTFGATNTLGSADTKRLVLEENLPLHETSNLIQTSFNYINSIIGSGVVGIAYALKQAGFGMGLILLVTFAAITDYSLCILIKAGLATGTATYQDLVQAAFGLPGFYILTFMQFIYPFIAMVSYNVIIGDTITKVFMRIFNGKPWKGGTKAPSAALAEESFQFSFCISCLPADVIFCPELFISGTTSLFEKLHENGLPAAFHCRKKRGFVYEYSQTHL